jgi:tetratricopeptide (TPR) repeat protein
MRLIAMMGAAALWAVLGLAPSAAAENTIVSDCLKSSGYLDGEETFNRCDKALGEKDLSNETRAAIFLQLGEAFYFNQRPGLAIPNLDEAIKLDPKLGQAYRRRGWSHFRLENMSAAMADFTEFLALSPDDADAQFAMAFVRFDHQNDCASAVREYERILAQHPDHHLTRRALAGQYACVDGNPMRQLAELNKLLALGREAIADTNYYGRRGRSDRDFYAIVMNDRAGIYYDANETEKAIADYDWVIENYPRIPFLYVDRGNMRLSGGDLGGALDDADKAIALYSDFPNAQLLRLKALNGLKRDAETVTYASDVTSRGYVSPEAPRIYFYRAVALKRLGRKSEATEDFSRAMAANSDLAWAIHAQLGQSGYLFGDLRGRQYGDGGPPPDPNAREFRNALAACLVDPECMR